MKRYLLPLILILLLTFALIGDCVTYTSQYPPTHDDDHVKATTRFGDNYFPFYATDPAKSLTGDWATNCWISSANTDQRFHVDLGSAKIIKRIYYENIHHEGGITDAGAKNFTFWGSNTGVGSFDDLVWGNDEDWTELTVATNVMLEHVALDQADPQFIIVTNSTAYRYYAFKFADNYTKAEYLGVRRVELQTEDAPAGITWNTKIITKWNTKTITIPINTQ